MTEEDKMLQDEMIRKFVANQKMFPKDLGKHTTMRMNEDDDEFAQKHISRR